ncbi:PD-(D/E)XK nuclease family protein [Providencia stuartii]|uniref:PDDEXK-like family protein n=1 Tax=Providencia stuartii TaxID=588 RepID=UPI000E046AD9|nr:PD-(D/E)XK nuclease family protein [Providencia stuartii]SUC46771.1 Uncharacterised protein [Providencia stuartii]HEM8214738.1 PD-(D/E)XK nuclease family protein [Providencia stuartii]
MIRTPSLDYQLSLFLKDWPTGIFNKSKSINKPKITFPLAELEHFFSDISNLSIDNHSFFSFNPWEVSGLKRNEVRNSSVLAWLLTPNGSHGFGKTPILTLLKYISQATKKKFPTYFNYCYVNVEINPSGDPTNRVDIQIRADNFYLLVEVKIDADEQKNQIARYCVEAEKTANKRPWGIVYLTPDGRQPISNNELTSDDSIFCLSWQTLSSHLRNALQTQYQSVFATNNHSPMRQFAALSVWCFLDQIEQF